MQNAGKVGLLVVVFVAMLFGAYQVLGKSLFAKPSKTIYAVFSDVAGVNIGSAVTMSGVKIGVVDSIALMSPSQAKIGLSIDESVQVPEGSQAQIPSSLIGFGDSPLLIIPPTKSSGVFLASGATIQGSKPSPLDAYLPDVKTTISELNKTLVAARGLLEDQSLKTQITSILKTTEGTIDKFGALAANLNGALAENRSSIQGIMTSLGSTMKDVQKATQYATKLLQDPKFKREAEAILATLSKTATGAEQLLANVNQMVADPKLRDPLNNTMSNVEKITDSGTRIASNTEQMTQNGVKISENGVKISENVVDLTKKANELADQAKTVLEKLQKFFDKVPSTSPTKGITTDISLTRESNPTYWRTDVEAKLPINDGNVILGLWDAFESNKITAQYGKKLSNSMDYRYGIYASKPGLGVDYRLAPKVSLRGDLFDINDPRLDLRARIELGSGLYGWLGADRVFNKNALSIGLGIRK